MEMVLLSTHNICFDREIRKLFFYLLLSGGLYDTVKRPPKLVFKTDYRLMKVKSIAECSNDLH